MQAEIEEFLARASASGGVVLGRGGAVVLASVPGALHVHLTGPREARVEQAMEIEGIDQKTAEQRLEAERPRPKGVRSSGPTAWMETIQPVPPRDRRLRFDLDACADLIATASRMRMQHAERHARS